LLTCHNDVIDAGHNNRLFAPGTDMDRERLRLSHMQNGMYFVQICDKRIYKSTMTDVTSVTGIAYISPQILMKLMLSNL